MLVDKTPTPPRSRLSFSNDCQTPEQIGSSLHGFYEHIGTFPGRDCNTRESDSMSPASSLCHHYRPRMEIHLPGAGVLHTRYGFAIATSMKIKAAKKLLIAA